MADAALSDLRRSPVREEEDFELNLFTAKGFALAQRIAMALQEASAIPAAFRRYTTKREKRGSDYVDVEIENPSAFGNTLVAIEKARAIGMSVTAVMENADVIDGELRWSGKFLIAAVNASGLFTNLRFRTENKGLVKVKYKEKGAWNNVKRGYDFTEHEIEVENIECTAWAYEIVNGKADMSEKIEGVKVSIKMAVEEGWYTKPGSKWPGEMKPLMLEYRAGSFFANTKAPQIAMGLGKTKEEIDDVIDVHPTADGKYAADVDALREQAGAQRPAASEPQRARSDTQDATTVEATDVTPPAATAGSQSAAAAQVDAPRAESAPAQSGAAAASPQPTQPTPPEQVGMEFDDRSGNPPASNSGPGYTHDDTLEMAIEAVSKGDYDAALDLKANLPDLMKKRIDAAIQGHRDDTAQEAKEAEGKQAQAQRPRRSYSV
jgi:hypothetical protein